MKLRWVAILSLAVGLAACSKKNDSYKYQFNENGCDTGEHSFSSKGDMCAALKDDGANRFCAVDLREDRYRQDCGTDWSFTDAGAASAAGSDYSYQFSSNGCDTGMHSFTSLKLMCVALADDALNRGCAADLRAQYFRQVCISH